MKRQIEIFTAGCPVCEPVIKLVKETVCDHCKITVYDLVKQCDDKTCITKAGEYGITCLPAIVVDGKLLHCCDRKITKSDLTNAGIGQTPA